MSHFYGKVRGLARTIVTRRGSPKSGLEVNANAWNHGITVLMDVETIKGKKYDVVRVFTTGGSNNEEVQDLVYKTEVKHV